MCSSSNLHSKLAVAWCDRAWVLSGYKRMHLLQGKDEAAQLRFSRRWINCHVDAAADIGKPVVLAEFGKKGCGPAREEFYRKASSFWRCHAICSQGQTRGP